MRITKKSFRLDFKASEAVCYLKQKGFGHSMGAPIDLIASDVLDHYRTYSLIELYLHAPTKLMEQSCFQLEPHTRDLIIEKYYSIDDVVAREILGKKLTSRYRKDLDEVGDKTCVKLKSCRCVLRDAQRLLNHLNMLKPFVHIQTPI